MISPGSDFNRRELEARLSREMKRVAAPAGFADRVMSRIAATGPAQRRSSRAIATPRRTAWLAIAAMLLVGMALGLADWQWRQQQLRRERQQAELAQRQFDLAMQVTQRTLAGVQERISHLGEFKNYQEIPRHSKGESQ